MIERRSFVTGLIAAAAMPAHAAEHAMTPAERLEAMVRLRGDTAGGLTFGWLDAVRSTVIDGDIQPFCRLMAASVSRFERRGDLFEATTLEVAYYVDPKTGAPFQKFRFPGATHDVEVPAYRTGPSKVRFGIDLSEWEEIDRSGPGQVSPAFAPTKASVHLERSVGIPTIDKGKIFLRSDEYGRVYADKSKPPVVFYREWLIWEGQADAVLHSRASSIPSTHSYSALSSWRPWMQMGDIKGHTAENGHGAKVASPADFPEELRALISSRDPDVLKNPARALG